MLSWTKPSDAHNYTEYDFDISNAHIEPEYGFGISFIFFSGESHQIWQRLVSIVGFFLTQWPWKVWP